MNWRQAALLSLIWTLASCAAEGGSRGSGIESFILGNVTSVQPVTRASDTVAGIRVAIEGSDIKDETDADGNFSLQGDYEGYVTVVFQLTDAAGSAHLTVNIPAAGTLTLNNVHLSPSTEEAVAETLDVEFAGVVVDTDCRGMTLALVSAQQSRPDTDEYTVRLDTSTLQDADGNPVACETLRQGDHATVQGLVNADGTFGHATVQIQR